MPTTFPRLYRTFCEKGNILVVAATAGAEFEPAEPLDTSTVENVPAMMTKAITLIRSYE